MAGERPRAGKRRRARRSADAGQRAATLAAGHGNATPGAPPVATEVAQEGEDEFQLIMRVLKETNGVVAGPKGAAQRLGLKRTTLLSRMKRLGIDKDALV